MSAPTIDKVKEHYETNQHNRALGIECDLHNGIMTRWHPSCFKLTFNVGDEESKCPPLERVRLNKIISDFNEEGWKVSLTSVRNHGKQYFVATVVRNS